MVQDRDTEAIAIPELDPTMTIIKAFLEHLEYTLGKDKYSASRADIFNAVAYAVRDRLIERWLDTQQCYYHNDTKRVYYLSMEYLMGRSLENNLINLGILDDFRDALATLGFEMDHIFDSEHDAGLGNGGLGRLAACFLDSMATLEIPAYGYGIRYEYGIFRQKIENGEQVELPDNWLRYRNPWEFDRQEHLHLVKLFGRVETRTGPDGRQYQEWVDTEDVMAMAYDVPIPGYRTNTVNTMRLWSAKSTREFDLSFFNEGDYIRAVEGKMMTENISKVLYPADHLVEGKELRLKQEYFLAAATMQDVIYRFKKGGHDLSMLPQKVAVQLNDTHPSLAIPELMRILMDQEGLPQETAWDITRQVFAYTNHTIMPEALEKWPVWMLEQLLPRHLQIIYAINDLHLAEVAARFPGDMQRLTDMSLVEENGQKLVRMAHLAIAGSHSVNGVSKIHTEILKNELFRNFYELYPERFNNKTNGITQRRWLKNANPLLATLISDHIGDGWVRDLQQLKRIIPLAEDPSFQAAWEEVKRSNKQQLAHYIQRYNCLEVDPLSLFDCQVKRIHEYKRQLLNILHVISFYLRLKDDPNHPMTPRTFIFSGKAAPSYTMAKLIIRLINGVADVVNGDPVARGKLAVVFLANYGVSLAERILPAADLSEQISTAGTEASGTGNMKFALNGALTVGTLDGANIEIMEEVGRDNIFIFGLNEEEVADLRRRGYHPRDHVNGQPELARALNALSGGLFSPGDPGLFQPIVDSLLAHGDHYLVCADFAAYQACQQEVSAAFGDRQRWNRMSIINTANMGKFSSDRTIADYAREIWGIGSVDVSPLMEYRQRETRG